MMKVTHSTTSNLPNRVKKGKLKMTSQDLDPDADWDNSIFSDLLVFLTVC